MVEKTTLKKQNVQISQDKQNDKFWTKNEVEEKAFEFIAKFEGLHLKAYWDFKHCSIGYGTTTRNCSEVINEKEAKKRAIQKIKDIRKHNNFYDLDDNLEIALISFTYNLWKPPKNYDWYIKNWYLKALKNRMKLYIYAWEKRLKWLERRRNAEVSLF